MATSTLALLVENRPGVLNRVTGLIARRAISIESLTACPTSNPEQARIVITLANTALPVAGQLAKQLGRVVEVIHVEPSEDDLSPVNAWTATGGQS